MTSGAARRPEGEQPVERRVTANGVGLAYFEWAGEGPPLLFFHATSFHARCWDEVIRALPGRNALAIDMRGHGRSDRPDPPYSWDRYGDDVTALVVELDLHDAVAVGHSMGGHSVTYAAGRQPERFAGLLLVDPTIGAPEAYAERRAQGPPGTGGNLDYIERRRNEWSSWEEMVERFHDRFPFELWDRQVLADYCRYGLLPIDSGTGSEGGLLRLACPPAVEADTYRQGGRADVYDVIPNIDAPVRIVRAAPPDADDAGAAFSASPCWPGLAGRFTRASDVLLADHTHFIPMQSPALVAEHVRALLDEID